MATITKEKQYIIYTTDENKVYRYDINQGTWYGVKGTPIKTSPANVRNAILYTQSTPKSNLMLYIREIVKWEGAATLTHLNNTQKNALLTADRLDTAGLPMSRYAMSEYYLRKIGENFASFVKYYKEWKETVEAGEHNRLDYACDAYINFLEEQERQKKMSIYKDTVADMNDDTKRWFLDYVETRKNRENTTHELCVIGYYAKSPTGQMFIHTRNTTTFRCLCDDILNYSHALNVTLSKTQDFSRYYMELKNSYTAQKDAYDLRLFTQHYDKHREALSFENDKYIVVIPKTPQDITTEGARQKNCVAGYRDRIVNGNGYIVFVRHKDDVEKNYITCEVYNDGRIGQYYRACNANIRTTEEFEFYGAYAKHLNDNWNK